MVKYKTGVRRITGVLLIMTVLLSASCSGNKVAEDETSYDAEAFSKMMANTPNAPIIDVRTKDEFIGGHIEGAVNYNWGEDGFDQAVQKYDRAAPVFIYCLSGGRSSLAAEHMRIMGFKKVYELRGGLMQWRGRELPEITGHGLEKLGMSSEQYQGLLVSDKLVLVDFYAEWCAPCKRMEPAIDEISKEMVSEVALVRINADENKALCRELGVDALPHLRLYRNGTIVWSNTGYITREEMMKQLLR